MPVGLLLFRDLGKRPRRGSSNVVSEKLSLGQGLWEERGSCLVPGLGILGRPRKGPQQLTVSGPLPSLRAPLGGIAFRLPPPPTLRDSHNGRLQHTRQSLCCLPYACPMDRMLPAPEIGCLGPGGRAHVFCLGAWGLEAGTRATGAAVSFQASRVVAV